MNIQSFESLPIIGILRGFTEDQVEHILEIYFEAGFTTIEITMNTPQVEKMIRHAFAKYQDKLNIGAGTVCTLSELDRALDAGAQFIVTPILNEAVIEKAVEKGIPIFPGAYTPTEVYKAWQLGATAVKIFPAETGGLQHVKALLGPLDQIKLIPTGGVDIENIAAFFGAGIYGVGMASKLFPKAMVELGDWDELKQHLLNIKAAYGN